MMTATSGALEKLHRVHPEWKPWLSVIEAVLTESNSPGWDVFVPEPRAGSSEHPRLAGLTLSLEANRVEEWIRRLLRVAAASGAPRMTALSGIKHRAGDALPLFQASLCRDEERFRALAGDWSVDAEGFLAIAELFAVPFLQACVRRWSASAFEGWSQGFCPACAAWPAFAEVRGIERTRHLRCARCGSGWEIHWLRCPYCATTDHNQLVTLVPEDGNRTRTIEACRSCGGYIKSFTLLQPSRGATVILDDLESVDLDIAALQQGYKRASGTGCPLDVKVVPRNPTKRKFSLWNP
jgi:FdhE protein